MSLQSGVEDIDQARCDLALRTKVGGQRFRREWLARERAQVEQQQFDALSPHRHRADHLEAACVLVYVKKARLAAGQRRQRRLPFAPGGGVAQKQDLLPIQPNADHLLQCLGLFGPATSVAGLVGQIPGNLLG